MIEKRLHILILFVFFLSAGCSDIQGILGGLLGKPPEEKSNKEDTKLHKLENKDPVSTFTAAGVPDISPEGEEGLGTTEDAGTPPSKTPAGKEVSKAPDGSAPPTGAPSGGTTTPPKGKENVSKTDKTPAKGDAPPEGVTPPKEKTIEKTPDAKKETPGANKGVKGIISISGEDIALISLIPEGGATTSGDLLAKGGADEIIFDPRKTRDPFRPFNVRVEKKNETSIEELTPLQKYKLSQLELKAIIYDSEKETGVAMVEDPTKKGFNIYVGTRIGDGKVVKITPEEVQVEVVVEESFYGEEETKTIIETLRLSGVNK